MAFIPPEQMDALSGLIDLLREPERTQAALKELKQSMVDHQALLTKTEADMSAVKQQREEIVTREKALEHSIADFARRVTQWDQERLSTNAAIATTQDDLRKQRTELEAREKYLESVKAALDERVSVVTQRERAAAELHEIGKGLKSDYEARLKRIKEATAA